MGATKGTNNKGGRKPIPAVMIDPTKTHMPYEEIERRKQAEKELTATANDILQPPTGMTSVAKKEWNRIIALYKELPTQILCDLDFQILKAYCDYVATYEECCKIIKHVKATCKREKREFRLSLVDVELKTQNKCIQEIRALTEQLCLSPLARARLGVNGNNPPVKEDNDLDALFDD